MFKRTRDYAKDYDVVEKEGRKPGKVRKEVVYRGRYFSFNLTYNERIRMKGAYGAAMLILMSVYGIMGVTGAQSLGANGAQASFYVLLPYVVALLPLGMCVAKTALLIFGPEKMEYAQYDKYVVMLKSYTVFMTISGCVILLGQIIYIMAEGGGSPDLTTPDGLFALVALIFAAISYGYLKLQSSYKCVEMQK